MTEPIHVWIGEADTIVVKKLPKRVDCVLSAWSEWVNDGAPTPCVNGTQQQPQKRTRTVVKQPSGGGAACGPLTETQTISVPCTVAPPPPPPPTAQYAAMTKTDGSPLYMVRSTVGQDSLRYFDHVQEWQGCMVETGGNNHSTELNNSVALVDPVAREYRELIPWHQQKSATDPTPLIPPVMNGGFNQYVATYDNYPAMIIHSLGWLVYPGFGIADLNAKKWLCGSRPPFTRAQGWKSMVKLDLYSEAAFDNGASVYDTCTLDCPALDISVTFGSNTGVAGFNPHYFVLRKNPSYPATDQRPLEMLALPKTPHSAWLNFGYNLGCGAVKGTHALIGGGAIDDGFGTQNRNVYDIDLSACAAGGSLVLVDTYTDAIPRCDLGTPHPVGVWPQMRYHPTRDRFYLFGRRVYELSPTTRKFEDIQVPNYGLIGVPGLAEGGGFDSPGVATAADGAFLIKGGIPVQPNGTQFTNVGGVDGARIYRLMLGATSGGSTGGGTTTGGTGTTPPTGAVLSTKPANPALWSGSGNKHSKLFQMNGRVYKFGGDGDLASGHGQPRSGQDVAMPDGSHLLANGQRGFHGQGVLGMVSFDPKAAIIEERLEFPMIPRNVGTSAAPVPEPCSLKVCEGSAWVDKDGRAYLYSEHDYGMYAYFNADGTGLNKWANGEMQNPNAPSLRNNMRGIYEWLPATGKQRLHSTARMLYDYGGNRGITYPEYDASDPKILWRPEMTDPDGALADCAYDPVSHRAYWIGYSNIYAYNHALDKFESYGNSWGSVGGYSDFACQGSNAAVCDGHLYHLAFGRKPGGAWHSYLCAIDIPAMLAGTNVASCTTVYELPFPMEYSAGYPAGNGIYTRYCGVRAAAGRVAVIGSYGGILLDGRCRVARFDCATKQWIPTPPATTQMYGNAWCSLEDSVLFACSIGAANEVNYLQMA